MRPAPYRETATRQLVISWCNIGFRLVKLSHIADSDDFHRCANESSILFFVDFKDRLLHGAASFYPFGKQGSAWRVVGRVVCGASTDRVVEGSGRETVSV
jgi:hypothetical protein